MSLGEAPGPLVSPNSEYIRWASAEPDRAYLINGCGAAPEETGVGAPFDACVDAWRYLGRGDAGYTYGGVANVFARP